MTLAQVIHRQVTTLPPEKQAEVLDFVLFLQHRVSSVVEPEDVASRRRRLATALEALRHLGTFADIVDPVAWQREVRQDRPLTGRED